MDVITQQRNKARVKLRAHDAERWIRHFRCSRRELALAVEAVGGDPIDVAAYLERLCLQRH